LAPQRIEGKHGIDMDKYKPEDTTLIPEPEWSLGIINESASNKVSIAIR